MNKLIFIISFTVLFSILNLFAVLANDCTFETGNTTSPVLGEIDGSWRLVDENWYYYDENGQMVTNWKKINEKWYYFGADGQCMIDTVTPDGYTVNSNGEWIPDVQRVLGLELKEADISKIEIYESPYPTNTTKRVFTAHRDIVIILEALNSMQISEETTLGFAPGGVVFICIHKADGKRVLISYGSSAICFGNAIDNPVYTVINTHDFWGKLNSLDSLEYEVGRDELSAIFE